MKKENSDTTLTTFRNMIGGNHLLSEEYGALSLVRKFGAAHAYLVLERVNEGERLTVDVHLVVKHGTEDLPNQKGEIVYREIGFQMLYDLSQGCHSVTWSIDTKQMEAFERLVKQEKKRADQDEIGYCVVGYAKGAGLFGSSLEQLKSESIKEWSIQHSHSSASEFLLKREHNCYSWAQAMVINLGFSPPTKWSECFAKDPRRVIEGARDGDASEEPSTGGGKCLVM